MSSERLQSALLVLGMVLFFFLVMPGQVDDIRNARIVPRTVPTIAIWTIIVFGVVQFARNQVRVTVDWALCARAAICAGFLIGCVAAMEHFGFEYVAPALALGIMLGIGERRLHWLLLGGFVIPLGVWLLVERVLDRALA